MPESLCRVCPLALLPPSRPLPSSYPTQPWCNPSASTKVTKRRHPAQPLSRRARLPGRCPAHLQRAICFLKKGPEVMRMSSPSSSNRSCQFVATRWRPVPARRSVSSSSVTWRSLAPTNMRSPLSRPGIHHMSRCAQCWHLRSPCLCPGFLVLMRDAVLSVSRHTRWCGPPPT